jgi:Holliday junction resolvase RusA-like endonuclease
MASRTSAAVFEALLCAVASSPRIWDVKWTVTIPGVPPSVNHSYRPVMIPRKDRYGRTILNDKGRPVTRIGMAKQSAVLDYQTAVVHLARSARPSHWQPAGQWIRISYRFFLKRSLDCDNAMKALNDALAMAIGVNDERFLPCVLSKNVDSKESNPRVEIEISDHID